MTSLYGGHTESLVIFCNTPPFSAYTLQVVPLVPIMVHRDRFTSVSPYAQAAADSTIGCSCFRRLKHTGTLIVRTNNTTRAQPPSWCAVLTNSYNRLLSYSAHVRDKPHTVVALPNVGSVFIPDRQLELEVDGLIIMSISSWVTVHIHDMDVPTTLRNACTNGTWQDGTHQARPTHYRSPLTSGNDIVCGSL